MLEEKSAKLATGVLVLMWILLLLSILNNSEAAEIRLYGTFGLHHDQGYVSPGLRIGDSLGLRVAALSHKEKENTTLVEVDYELCSGKYCAALGAAKLSDQTQMNGTEWNFGLHARYKIDRRWSIVLDHYSHGRMLGIAKDKSNRGWNLLGISYTFGR